MIGITLNLTYKGQERTTVSSLEVTNSFGAIFKVHYITYTIIIRFKILRWFLSK